MDIQWMVGWWVLVHCGPSTQGLLLRDESSSFKKEL